MKILVTGATGFIGSYVIKYLLHTEHQIIAMHNSNLKSRTNKQISYIQHNLYEDKNSNVFKKLHEPDALIHLAWSNLPNYKSTIHIEQVPFHEKFINSLIENGTKNITITGTCMEYGIQNGMLSENLTPNPSNYYAIAKNTLRLLLEQNKTDFNLKWLRLFYTYGEGQNPNSIIPQLHTAIKNNDKTFKMSYGEQIRDYLSVEKTAEYIVKATLQRETQGIINCCSGNPISIRRFVEQEIKKQKSNIKLDLGYYPYNDYEPFAFWGDNTKLQTIINS